MAKEKTVRFKVQNKKFIFSDSDGNAFVFNEGDVFRAAPSQIPSTFRDRVRPVDVIEEEEAQEVSQDISEPGSPREPEPPPVMENPDPVPDPVPDEVNDAPNDLEHVNPPDQF